MLFLRFLGKCIYIIPSLVSNMEVNAIINHLKVIVKIHEIDGQEDNFLYWELKSLLEEFI